MNDNIQNIFCCNNCNLTYKTKNGLWKHQNKYHLNEIISNQNPDQDIQVSKEYKCEYCDKVYNNKYSKYKHKKICEKKDHAQINELKTSFNEQIDKLKLELENVKNKSGKTTINNINKGVINNNKNNVYNFLTKPGEENLNILNEKEVEHILEQEMNCLVYLVEFLNFNKKHPENHSFCTTALNDKYISTLNTETLMIEKMRKKDFFDSMLNNGVKNIRFLYDKLKSKKTPKALRFKQTIDNLTEYVVVNNKGKKAYVEMMNTLTFNKRHITQSTWFQLMNNQIPSKTDNDNNDNNYYNESNKNTEPTNISSNKQKNKSLFIIPESDIDKNTSSESSSETNTESSSRTDSNSNTDTDSECDESNNELPEIKIKGKIYLLDGDKLYNIDSNGSKSNLYGILNNRKVIKIN